jgi:hypothetical protein
VRGAQVFSRYLQDTSRGLLVRDAWLQTRLSARERADGTYELLIDTGASADHR